MALTEEQAKLLAELQAQQDAPEPRTETGLAGLLHTLIDVVSGRVPHVAPEAWDALHKEAEAQAAGAPAEPEPVAPDGTETEPEPVAADGTETEPAG
jgi:leucyl-tRNA synthetase